MNYLALPVRKDSALFAFAMRLPLQQKFFAATLAAAFFLFLSASGRAQAQAATVNWTDVHQVIDGFGASTNSGMPLSTANQNLFFGTGSGQIGLSILRVALTNGDEAPGDCTSVSTSCAGIHVAEMQGAIANGARVYASPWSPPAQYMSNGSTVCLNGSGNGSLLSSDYAAYATWLANFVQSLKTEDNISLYAISIQNEPDQCQDYDSALWSASQIDTFIKNNLGPTFAADSLSTLIFEPEGGNYNATVSLGASCATDSSCNQYVGGYNWHDYLSTMSGTNTVAADPYPSGWAAGKKYWETEASCMPVAGPNFCESGFTLDITDGLDWGAVIDQRIAGDGANAWLYWWLVDSSPSDNESLSDGGSNVAKRAYVMGQYSKFVRPGYYRIDATRAPQSGVSVSAYQNTPTNTLVIVATNYTGSAVTQQFNITNAPALSSMTPTTTSASLSLATQPGVSVSNNSFTYTLPAQSITTFVGNTSGPLPPSGLAGSVVTQ